MPRTPKTTQNPCETCPAACCAYLNIVVENPRAPQEVNDLLWYIYHQASELYLDVDGDWSVVFHQKCVHLDEKNRCGIYERRPTVCRQFSANGCHGGNFTESVKEHFRTDRDFIHWIKNRRPALFKRLKPDVRRLAK